MIQRLGGIGYKFDFSVEQCYFTGAFYGAKNYGFGICKAAINDATEVLGITSVDDELGAVECNTVWGGYIL